MATTENDPNTVIRPGQNGGATALQRVGFGTVENVNQRETQGSALAERAKAEVQARWIMAVQRPRSIEQFRVRLLEHCKRKGFAEIAEYAKPVGRDKVRGPTIRFVETAIQEFMNSLPVATIVYDDEFKRIVQVSVTDLERNVTYYDDAIAEKFVERRNPKDGDEVLGSRQNSYGDTVYKVRATEDDFSNKMSAAVSKKTRNLGLRIMPSDIVAEAIALCRETTKAATAHDPAAARRALADAFAALRVMPNDLDAYLGHPFEQTSPAELDELRAVYLAVRDGEAKWPDLIEAQRASRGEIEKPSKAAEAASDKLNKKIEEVKAKQQAKAKDAASAAAKAKASETRPSDSNEPSDEEKREIERLEREGK